MHRHFVVMIAVCVAAIAAVAPVAQASFAGRSGSIAIGWFCSDTCPIFFIPEGGIFLPLPVQPNHLAWSPDGKRLAFDAQATSLGTGNALYIVNADGTGLTQVGRGDLLRYSPAWAPDGGKLAFTQDNGAAGSGDVYTITTTGGSLTRLTSAPSWEGGADWAADGSRIAYLCREAN